MSRQKRQLSQFGLYHIIFRGIGRQNIFEEKADFDKLKEILKRVKEEMHFELYEPFGDVSRLMLREKLVRVLFITKILSHFAILHYQQFTKLLA